MTNEVEHFDDQHFKPSRCTFQLPVLTQVACVCRRKLHFHFALRGLDGGTLFREANDARAQGEELHERELEKSEPHGGASVPRYGKLAVCFLAETILLLSSF